MVLELVLDGAGCWILEALFVGLLHPTTVMKKP
jgi:hypothetical protein